MNITANSRRIAAVIVIALFALPLVAVFGPAAGAQSCTSQTVNSPGLLWFDSFLSHTVSVSPPLPAGTYTVTGSSHDPTHELGDRPEQIQERWAFSADGAAPSAVTPDLPEAQTTLFVSFGEWTFGDPVEVITFLHRGNGQSPDSVMPTLVFTQCETEPVITVPITEVPTPTTEGDIGTATSIVNPNLPGTATVSSFSGRELAATGLGGWLVISGSVTLFLGLILTLVCHNRERNSR